MAQLILTMDSAGARLITRRDKQLVLLEALDHPEGRLHNSELDSDKPGRAFESARPGSRAMAPEESSHERVVADFVRRVSARLDQGRVDRTFDSLVIAAGPQLLGALRATLDKNTLRLVTTSIAKDLQQVPLHELDTHLDRAE